MAPTFHIFSEENRNLHEAVDAYRSMDRPCPYNLPAYLDILAEHLYDDIRLTVFFLSTPNGQVFYPFFKRSLKTVPRIPAEYHGYSDLIGSWYFGGPMVQAARDGLSAGADLTADYSTAFSAFCGDQDVIAEFIRFDPCLETHSFFDGYYDLTLNRDTVYVDLEQSYDAIWKGYKGRCRTAVRKAMKNNIRVSRTVTPERIDAFAAIYQAEMERKADSKHYFFSPGFFHDITEKLPDHFTWFFAFHGETLCGATIVYHTEEIAYDYLMATAVDYWQYQPNNILLDTAIKWACARGIRMFDLMGGRPGVFNFKSCFSDKRQKFYTGKRIHNQDVYARLVHMTREFSGASYNTDFFPVYRQLEMAGDA